MSSLLSRIGAWFVEPPPPAADRPLPPSPAVGPPVPPSPAVGTPVPPTPVAGEPVPPLPAVGTPVPPTPVAGKPVPPSPAASMPPSPATPPPTRFIPPTAARAHPSAPDTRADGAATSAPPATPPPADVLAPPHPAHAGAPAHVIGSATVLGAPVVVVPLAAACAGELRARAKAASAALCVWRPEPRTHAVVPADSVVAAADSPAGATTPGARRLAARLTAHELTATACGRLAWLALERDPAAAANQVRRCLAIADAPVVLAVAGARPPAFEPLLADVDLAIAVLPPDIEPALRDLALVTLRASARVVLPPLPPGPPRWAAMAGLARLRSLPRGES